MDRLEKVNQFASKGRISGEHLPQGVFDISSDSDVAVDERLEERTGSLAIMLAGEARADSFVHAGRHPFCLLIHILPSFGGHCSQKTHRKSY
jgi:hypothetical protein